MWYDEYDKYDQYNQYDQYEPPPCYMTDKTNMQTNMTNMKPPPILYAKFIQNI